MLASLLQTLLQFTKRVENNIYSKVWRTGTRLITCACHDLSTRGYFLDENNKLDSWPCLKYNYLFFFFFKVTNILKILEAKLGEVCDAGRALFPAKFLVSTQSPVTAAKRVRVPCGQLLLHRMYFPETRFRRFFGVFLAIFPLYLWSLV